MKLGSASIFVLWQTLSRLSEKSCPDLICVFWLFMVFFLVFWSYRNANAGWAAMNKRREVKLEEKGEYDCTELLFALEDVAPWNGLIFPLLIRLGRKASRRLIKREQMKLCSRVFVYCWRLSLLERTRKDYGEFIWALFQLGEIRLWKKKNRQLGMSNS